MSKLKQYTANTVLNKFLAEVCVFSNDILKNTKSNLACSFS